MKEAAANADFDDDDDDSLYFELMVLHSACAWKENKTSPSRRPR